MTDTTRRLRPYLNDMLEAARAAVSFVPDDMEAETLASEVEKRSAVLWQIALLGEAAKRIPIVFREAHPEIPFRMMAQTRDVLIHDYDGIDWVIVREILRVNLPKLILQLEELIASIEEEQG